MASSAIVSLTRPQTNSTEGYDHPIKLVDTTKPKVDSTQTPADDLPESSGASLSRKWTRGTLRKELAKRKYAKWQRDKGEVLEGSGQTNTDVTQHEESAFQASATTDQDEGGRINQQSKEEAAKTRSVPKAPEQGHHPDSVIDVLYENQRGWFLFGMPLYSANSLLNLDPAPWQNGMFQDSPVNITNAQVPDPSWQWAWRTWYVDMSHDVDEEGWEYSFSFQPRSIGGKGTMNESHRLNADYFTIHGAKRDRSPDSSAEGTLANRSSLMGYDGYESDSDQDVNDIPNVIALLAVLRKASVDREKIVAVRTFLAQGGEELNYLADNMAEIMGLLIYQTSRAQLLDHLVEAINRTKDSQASDTKSEDIDQEMIDRKIDNLKRAMNASRTYLSGLDYWADATENEKHGRSSLTVAPAFGNDDMDWPEETKAHIQKANTNNQIRGIPKEADVDTAPSPLRTAQEQAEGSTAGSVDKGKGKAQY